MAPDKSKMENIDFNLITGFIIDPNSLKFIWYMVINKIQIEFENGSYGIIWTGVMTHDKC